MAISIIYADYDNLSHQQAIVTLLNSYASDPMGGGQSLSEYVRNNLVRYLAQVSGAITLLAYDGSQPVGLLNAFQGFSTFQCKPILNIHDLAVLPDYRGQGVASALLSAIQKEAIARDCCKLTLEVLEGNKPAKQVYEKFGFKGYELDPNMGQAVFLEKIIE